MEMQNIQNIKYKYYYRANMGTDLMFQFKHKKLETDGNIT